MKPITVLLADERTTRDPRLTSREVEVLRMIAEGQANKQVAAELGISIKTVEKHRHHLMNTLGLHDTAGLTRYAISAGIIESAVRFTFPTTARSRPPTRRRSPV